MNWKLELGSIPVSGMGIGIEFLAGIDIESKIDRSKTDILKNDSV